MLPDTPTGDPARPRETAPMATMHIDGDRLATTHEAARARIGAMVLAAGPQGAAAPVPACPAWTVHQLLAHCTGTPASIVGGDLPTGDLQEWLDGIVAARADRPVEDLLAEWETAGPAIEATLRSGPGHLGTLVYDVLAHEHDLRAALGSAAPVDDDSVGVALELTVTHLRADLAAHGLPGVVLDAGHSRWVAGDEPAGLEISAPAYELFRLLGGRRSRAQLTAAVRHGDLDRFLPALTHGLAPTADDLRD
jgi:uncharacterized protein (TIGR03083 family)